jgi:hypothetical protein
LSISFSLAANQTLIQYWCEPSQNGLLADSPQRQRPKAVLLPRPYTIPLESIISKSPSILMDPLLLIINFVLPIELFIYLISKVVKYMFTILYFLIFFTFKVQFILILFYNRSIEGDIFILTTTEESPIIIELI